MIVALIHSMGLTSLILLSLAQRFLNLAGMVSVQASTKIKERITQMY